MNDMPRDCRPAEPPAGKPWDLGAVEDAWELIDRAKDRLAGAELLNADMAGRLDALLAELELCADTTEFPAWTDWPRCCGAGRGDK